MLEFIQLIAAGTLFIILGIGIRGLALRSSARSARSRRARSLSGSLVSAVLAYQIYGKVKGLH